jgi:hypothetical protein
LDRKGKIVGEIVSMKDKIERENSTSKLNPLYNSYTLDKIGMVYLPHQRTEDLLNTAHFWNLHRHTLLYSFSAVTVVNIQ